MSHTNNVERGSIVLLKGASNAPYMIVKSVSLYNRPEPENESFYMAKCFWFDKEQRPQTELFEVSLLYVQP
jgi:uncharacterized protein YodC (DUF2158 family)